jgi:hypothetical protein
MLRPPNRRLLAGTIAGAVLATALALPASAVNTVTQAVNGGTLIASVADLTLGAVTVTHATQPSTGNLTLTADDSTGKALGWNVSIRSSALAYSGGFGTSPANDIPAANLALGTPATPVMTAGQAVDVTNGPKVVGTGGALNATIKVINANAAGYGMGTYTQTLPLTLTIPANPRQGTYTGTLTVTVAAGP